jgi:hypothetical protein
MSKVIVSAVGLLAVAALSGCSSSGASVASASVTAATTASPLPSQAVSAAPSSAAPSVGTSAIPVVIRPHALPIGERIKNNSSTYKRPVTYTDGLVVLITGITQGKVTAVGPGEITGQPVTTFTVRFTNNTKSAIDLNGVVVSGFYGSAKTKASPVYDGGLNDFSGLLNPGATKSAAYAFSIPASGLASATLVVDFDGRHMPAVFSGPTS